MFRVLLRLLLPLQHLRVAVLRRRRRPAHGDVALVDVVLLVRGLLLRLLLLRVDRHRRLQKVRPGRVGVAAGHRIIRAGRQQEHAVIEQRLAQALLLLLLLLRVRLSGVLSLAAVNEEEGVLAGVVIAGRPFLVLAVVVGSVLRRNHRRRRNN